MADIATALLSGFFTRQRDVAFETTQPAAHNLAIAVLAAKLAINLDGLALGLEIAKRALDQVLNPSFAQILLLLQLFYATEDLRVDEGLELCVGEIGSAGWVAAFRAASACIKLSIDAVASTVLAQVVDVRAVAEHHSIGRACVEAGHAFRLLA